MKILFKLRIFFIIFFTIFIIFIFLFNIRVKDVDIKGQSWYTKAEIEDLIFTNKFSKISILILKDKILNNKKNIPFVQDYNIIFKNPFSIELIIYEKSVVASVKYMNSYLYFDKDGIIIESSSKKIDGIPVILNLKLGNIILYKKLPVENDKIFSEILNLTQILKVKNIAVKYIEYNNNRIALYINKIKVEINRNDDLNNTISILADILPKLKDLEGELYLDSNENGNFNGIYTFKKK